MLKPRPDNSPDDHARHERARKRRNAATLLASKRTPLLSVNNGEIERYAAKPTCFHKGLPHDEHGIPDGYGFEDFVTALNREESEEGDYARFDVALGPSEEAGANAGRRTDGFAVERFAGVVDGDAVPAVRNWESPLGGHCYDLEGPDAGDVAMAPAPTLPSSELVAEMAEVYALALLRDVPFSKFGSEDEPVRHRSESGSRPAGFSVGDVIRQLNGLRWFRREEPFVPSYGSLLACGEEPTALERQRRAARFRGDAQRLDGDSAFRGSTRGCMDGPYLSQFLLIGNPIRGHSGVADGSTRSGATSTRGAAHPDAANGRRDGGDDGADGAPGGESGGRSGGHSGERGGSLAAGLARLDKAKDHRQVARGALPWGVSAAETEPPGGDGTIDRGYISYGAQRIDQRVIAHLKGRDYMTDWPLWLDVQNGADVSGTDRYTPSGKPGFIATPRDLATFVHFDALYQAYLNACLLLFSFNVPFDFGFPSGKAHVTRGSFATFGGPHVLSLLTEVATRALKAVRRQKFQQHLRCRPEQLAAMLTLSANGRDEALGDAANDFGRMLTACREEAPCLLGWIAELNAHHNAECERSGEDDGVPTIYPRRRADGAESTDGARSTPSWEGFVPAEDSNYLLPMAFPEGSPMHAAYGAGHATVAGACTTILKAFFEMSTGRVECPGLDHPLSAAQIKRDRNGRWWKPASMGPNGLGLERLYRAPDGDDQSRLSPVPAHDCTPDALTIEGELNKLAANISIGRNMAGVHFYTDYFDSLRMGERIAVGILEEQLATYPDAASMRLRSFDDDALLIHGNGKGGTRLDIGDADGTGFARNRADAYHRAEQWRARHVAPFQPATRTEHA